LFIAADDKAELNCHDIQNFFKFVFERIDFSRDLHFQTKTSIDTLDYSGSGLNEGSKVVIAAYGDKCRELSAEVPQSISRWEFISAPVMLMEGVLGIQIGKFITYADAVKQVKQLSE